MHPALEHTDHRPWPLPREDWRWRQSWHDLLFAHWPISVHELRPLVPRRLEIQQFDGTSWIGIVPFHMSGVMRRPWPDVPGLSAFPELNVRLYVQWQAKPGVWFLSLDASNRLAVWAARRWFHLPYFHADIPIQVTSERVDFCSTRRAAPAGLRFAATYQPVSGVYQARPGTLEHWLTERYCLYAQSPQGQLFRTEVQHVPWPLQRAQADIRHNDMCQPWGISIRGAPLLHFSSGVDVVVWSPVPV